MSIRRMILCFERRLKRDIEERGRTPEMVREQYERTVRPTSVAYVRPSAKNADLIVDGTARWIGRWSA